MYHCKYTVSDCVTHIRRVCSLCVLMTACVCMCMWLVLVEDMPVIDGSQCHGKAGPQSLVVHFNSYFQTAGNFLEIGNRGLAVIMFPLQDDIRLPLLVFQNMCG